MELSQLKKTIDWRTEVALQQEIAIKSKEKIADDQRKRILNFEQELKNMRTESIKFPLQVKSIKDMVDELEQKYSKSKFVVSSFENLIKLSALFYFRDY